MKLYFEIFGLRIPSYGTMIVAGLLLANAVAWFRLKKRELDFNDFMIMEAYAAFFGFAGAKLLYFFVSRDQIDWSLFFHDFRYMNTLMRSGFVFYGGILLGVPAIALAGRIHKIKIGEYLQHVLFMVPLIHCFGRIGCYLAGCCYGVRYEGHFSVVFPEGSLAPSGISLFPVQLLEAVCLLVIFGILFFLEVKGLERYGLVFYLLSYGILRFFLEKLRYDEARGFFLWFSTSQWISFFMIGAAVVIGMVSCIRKRRKERR